jgi:hypothetical protein
MSTPSPDRKRAAGLIVGSALVSALGVGALAYTATNAAFSGTTDNSANAFTAASVSLTDDDGGTEMFNVSGLLPGDTVSDCIVVTYNGSTTDLAGLRLYGASSAAATDELSDDLTLRVQHGAAGGTCAAPGALTDVYATGDLTALGTNYATGSIGFTPTGIGQSVPYLFDVTLKAATPNSAQGDTAMASFTWEVFSN